MVRDLLPRNMISGAVLESRFVLDLTQAREARLSPSRLGQGRTGHGISQTVPCCISNRTVLVAYVWVDFAVTAVRDKLNNANVCLGYISYVHT